MPFIGYPPSFAREWDEPVAIWRTYPREWMETIFRPAAKVESWVRQIEVEASSPIENFPQFDFDSCLSADSPSGQIADEGPNSVISTRGDSAGAATGGN